jgi:hypothetical protein
MMKEIEAHNFLLQNGFKKIIHIGNQICYEFVNNKNFNIHLDWNYKNIELSYHGDKQIPNFVEAGITKQSLQNIFYQFNVIKYIEKRL